MINGFHRRLHTPQGEHSGQEMVLSDFPRNSRIIIDKHKLRGRMD